MRVAVGAEPDIMAACRQARQLAERLGFSRTGAYHVATAASELAANLWIHGGGGLFLAEAVVADLSGDRVIGIELRAEDRGPGIADLDLALTEGYSTGSGLGCGLPGVRRLMDDFSIDSGPGRGTRVRAVKWR